jgi:hypothetical protein
MRNKIVLIGIISLMVLGCKKPPTSQNLSIESSTAYPTTIAQLNSILADGYANFRTLDLYGWEALPAGFSCSAHDVDENGPLNLADQNTQAWSNNPPANAQWVTNMWAGYFIGVKDANSTLEAADFYEKNYAVASDSPTLRYIRGQAYCLRAFYYMQLECFYGEKYIDIKQPASTDANVLGVPIYTRVPATLIETAQPRATARQVWNLITNDLTTAATLLKNVSWGTNDEGRVTDYTAKGLLGKAYVFTQNWDSAVTVLNDVITNGHGPQNLPLTLMPFSQYQQAFNAPAFPGSLNSNTAQKFNQESLFELEVDRVQGNGGYGIFGNAPNEYLTTSQGLFWAPSGFLNTGATGSKEGMGYGALFFQDRNLKRFGFYVPEDSLDVSSLIANQSFVSPAVANAAGYVSTTEVPGLWYQHVSDSFRNSPNGLGADPRLYVNALEPYMDTVLFSGIASPADQARLKRPVSKNVNILVGGTHPDDGFLGWSVKKYQTLDANMNEVGQSDGANYYLLRLADIYLLYAEALMPTNQVLALEYINKVHRRAYGLDTNTPNALYDYASLTAATKADPSDVNLHNNPLAYERHAELFLEGHWWFDVCRWGNSTGATAGNFNPAFGQNEANYYGSLLPNQVPSIWSSFSYCYPIPTLELTSNPGIAAQVNGGQNPGY